MDHKQGTDRNQMYMFSLESAIAEDAYVRVVDAFVNALDLKSFGFANVECQEEGRPPYHPSVLLKLYLYGYRYGIRSSRKLEREAQTNIEAMWLLQGLRPKFKTIADFRKKHPQAFRDVFKKFVWMLKQWNLVEGKTIAIDSFKIRGSNSIKNNFNEKKIQKHLAYLEKQISEFEAQLDAAEDTEVKKKITQKIQKRKQKHEQYQQIKEELKHSDLEQISTTDPDSRSMIVSRNHVEVGYNIQASSDEKHKFLIDYDTGLVNDKRALADMASRSKEILQEESLVVLADKGYHSGEELHKCKQNNIIAYVAPVERNPKTKGLFPLSSFQYDPEKNAYTCPEGHLLTSNNKLYNAGVGTSRYKNYNNTAACRRCQSRQLCTSSKHGGRQIIRAEYADVIKENADRIALEPELYKQRQQITEHMFGTLKRQRGFDHTLVRGKEKVLGEVGLSFIAYNLSRCITVVGAKKLIQALKECCLSIFLSIINVIFSCFELFLEDIRKSTKIDKEKIDISRYVLGQSRFNLQN